MKHSIPAILISMMALLPLVNASAKDLPTSNQPTKKAALKDSVKERPSDLSRLIDMLMHTGDEDRLLEHLSPLIGLTGTPPAKGRDFTLPRPKGKERRECTIVFSDDSQNVSPEEKRITCLYIQHKIVSGHDSEAMYYRFNIEGKLEHVTVNHGKNDDDGKPILGSGVAVDKDIDSPDVQKAFKAELSYWTKDWLKKEQKIIARAKRASASKAATAGVSISASAESNTRDKEAAVAPATTPTP